MKYYSACSVARTGNTGEVDAVLVMPPRRILLSYFYEKDISLIKTLQQKDVEIFIDSGAFSAYSSKKLIDIDEYCKFLLECGVQTYAGLDVIGNAEATMKNQKYAEETYGLKPIPTFHIGSVVKDLDALIGYDYIAFGGLVMAEGIEEHLNEAWRYVLDRNSQIKVHGFGLTNLKFIEKYPWYSVDSSSFKGCKRFGRQALLWGGMNFNTLSEDEFIDFLTDKFLYSKVELKENNKMRRYLEDLFAVNSMKTYVDIVTEIHKYKDFSFLTHQKKLL